LQQKHCRSSPVNTSATQIRALSLASRRILAEEGAARLSVDASNEREGSEEDSRELHFQLSVK